jgi:alpha-L-arabinofuranosidase
MLLHARIAHHVAALAAGALVACGVIAAVPASAGAAGGPAPVAHWAFDEGTGTTAADSTGAHPAALLGGAGWTAGIRGPSALQTNGTSAYADGGAPPIDVAHSFTVSAWVRLDRTTGYQTVVSIDGDQVSNFYLQFRDDTRRFAFVHLPTDAAQGAPSFPAATFDPVAGQWYLLTGVYDAAAKTLSLYVDGRLQDTTPAPEPWAPSGHLVIGRGKFAGNPVDFVQGAIDDVRVYDQALNAADVAQLATSGTWRLDEGTGTTAHDDSLDGNDGTLSDGATWTSGVVGAHAVAFDGTSGVIDVPAPVIDTSQGFSVAAWVRVDSPDGFRTAVSVDGDQVGGFYLQRRGDGRFAFTRLASDSSGAAATFAASSATARIGQWYHLVGVYDGVARTLTLYVNGTPAQTVSFTSPWKAGGHLVIGRGKFGGAPADFFDGAIDDVRTYPFPLDAQAAAALATSGLWHFDEGAGTVAHDASPDGADGTLRGASWTSGASKTAVALPGDGDVTMGDAPALDIGTGSASLSAWVRTRGSGPVVSKGDGYLLAVDGGQVHASIGTGAGRIDVTTTSAAVADDAWHNATLVLDRAAQRLTLYVDGEPAPVAPADGSCGTPAGSALDVSSCTSASGDSDQPFTVGSTSGDPPRLTGAVDEVQLVRFALTAAQVADLAGFDRLAIDATDVRAATHSTQYGAFLEDISHSGDGGLYAELVRNRTFKEAFQGAPGGGGPVPYWSLVSGGGADGSFAIDTAQPLTTAIDRSLRLHVATLPAGGRVAAANAGYYGVAVAPSTTYKGSLWAKATPGWTGRARVSLEKADGTVLASRVLGAIGGDWSHLSYTLKTPAGIATSTDNRVVVSLENGCTGRRCQPIADQDVWLAVVSLFPPTYKNRANGMRRDLMEKIAAMQPGFFRVPGGNYLEGNTLATRFDWKKTIGPIWERPGHQNTAWGYWSTDGLGLLEYLRLAEDVGAQPLLAVFAGYTLNGQHVPEEDFGPYVQDALDEIEYAIGDTSTTWGARRAADGHPKPFDLHYVEIGNEDFFDSSGSYEWRFADMYDAIKDRYPQLKIVATTPVSSRTPDVIDDHYYNPPSWFVDNANRYDRADRSGPRVIVGEYGALDGSPTGTLRAAVGEASFLTGLERNSDLVLGSTYAPIIVNENAPNWPTNLFGIDASRSYGSPSYWVQRMFSTNLGRNVIGSALSGAQGLRQAVTTTRSGGRTTFYVKLVNPTSLQHTARLSFGGVGRIDSTGTLTVLTGDPSARNTLDEPDAIAPTTREVSGLGTSTKLLLPPSSVTVLRVTGS